MQTNGKDSEIRCRLSIALRTVSLLIGSFLVVFSSIGANSPYIVKVQHYSLGEGLPQRGILSIGQDPQGYVWIGTLNNAYRFDGHVFKSFPVEQASNPVTKSSQLTALGSVSSIRTDLDGNLWLFKFGSQAHSQIDILVPGQQKLISFEKRFHQKLPFDLSGSLLGFPQLLASARPTDPIIIPDLNGAVFLYKGQGKFKQIYQHPYPEKIRKYYKRSYEDKTPLKLKNFIVTPAGTTLITYASENPLENELTEIWPNGKIRRQLHVPAQLHPVSVDSQGTIYLAYYKYVYDEPANLPSQLPRLMPHQIDALLYQLSPDGKLTNVPVLFQKNPFPNPSQYSFVNDKVVYDAKHGLYWFLGKNVLFAWHPKRGIVFDLAASGFPVASLIDINQLFVDRTGAIWVATQNGVLLLTLEPNHFQRYLYVPDEETAIPKLSTRGIVKTGDWLWVNALHGMIHLKTGEVRKAISGEHGPAILSRDKKKIWAISESLVQIDPITLSIQKFSLQPNPKKYCWVIWEDGKRNFWLGYDEGMSYFDTQQKQNHPFTRYNQYPELATSRINDFFPDSTQNGLWVASSSGLYVLDTLRGITARYSSRDAAPHHLPFDHITFLHHDRTQPGIYWLATRGGGLIRWEQKTGRWQQFTQEQGLSNNDIYSVHEDRNGYLWLPSNYGLMRFHKQTHQVQVFLPKDGITHEEFNLKSYYQSPDGELFLGGLNGITAFRPNDLIKEKPVIVPLRVTNYEQFNASTGQRTDHLPEFQQNQEITIPPQNRTVSLSFALLDYRYGRQFRLLYRIVGWQNYWTAQFRRDVSINGLLPGTYQLQVRAQNPNGQWASRTLTIPIRVLKPFYLQTWFLTLIFLTLIGLTIGFFQWRNYRLRQETRRLEEEVNRRTAQIAQDKAVIEQQAADLQASATLKSRFFANVSHEFRTPLTLLLGPLTHLSKQLSDPSLTRLVNTMDRNARQLLTMVSDLLDLSKLDASQMQLANQPADLAQVTNQTVSKFMSQADYTGIKLTVEGTGQPIWMLLDTVKIETVLTNLLANALKFTPAGGVVSVQVLKQDKAVRVAVQDTGSGIHPDDLPHIFERYYQSQQPDAPLRGGTGIGLALSHEYCHLWGGQLTVASQLGKGSTFSFTYPYEPVSPLQTAPAPPSPAQLEPVADSPEPEANPVRSRILLVEDNPDMTEYLSTILAPAHLLHTTRNGREAWDWLNTLTNTDYPQLILTDLMMPDMDGLALVNEIRQHPDLRDIPVLMLTARTSQDVKLQALRLGVADYMTKPFDEDELLTRISNLFERSQERTVWQQHLPGETALASPPSVEDEWLIQLQQVTLKNLTNRYFQVNTLADAVHSSERQLYRRLKKLTGFSPNQFIQEIRLQTAREWLENQRFTTVKEVCYAVGFQDTVYFSRLFLQRFGKYPMALLRTTDELTPPEQPDDYPPITDKRPVHQRVL
ncbi:hybrid sensor histidine kinase/response regulator transcription factor [Larkinella rosea]|nr:ATP-binding protein [Larkinella rosea]